MPVGRQGMLGRAHGRPLVRPQPTPHSQLLHTPAARSDTTPNTAADNLSAKGRICRGPAGGSGRMRPQAPRQTSPVRSATFWCHGYRTPVRRCPQLAYAVHYG